MHRSRFSLEGDSACVELFGNFESAELLDLIEFYKSKGYNKISTEYETLMMSKESEGNRQVKEIEDLKFDIQRQQEYLLEKDKEIGKLELKIQKILNAKQTTLEQFDAFIELKESYNKCLTNLSDMQRTINENNLQIRENDRIIKELRAKMEKMKEIYIKKVNEEISE